MAVVSLSAIRDVLPMETPELCGGVCAKERDDEVVDHAPMAEIDKGGGKCEMVGAGMDQEKRETTIRKQDGCDENSCDEEDCFCTGIATKPDKLQSSWEEEGEPLIVCGLELSKSPPRDGSFRRRYNSAIGNLLHFDGQRLWAESSPGMQRRVSA